MNADERAITDYLKGWPNAFVSGREIARKVGGKKRYEEDHGWAISALTHLVMLGLVEGDHYGYFRLKADKKKRRPQTHISPQMLKILEKSGKTFEGIAIDEDVDEAALPTYTNLPSKPA
jgi:hypothetical protein